MRDLNPRYRRERAGATHVIAGISRDGSPSWAIPGPIPLEPCGVRVTNVPAGRAGRRSPRRRSPSIPTAYRYFPILTSRPDDIALVEADHRDHAQIELVIRDLKDAGLAHVPSGRIYANMAWLVLASLAHICSAGSRSSALASAESPSTA